LPFTVMMAWQRAGSVIGIKPTNPQGTGMAGTDCPALPVGGGGRCAAIRRDVADRQRFATVFGDGF
jgi:hypothetical protein